MVSRRNCVLVDRLTAATDMHMRQLAKYTGAESVWQVPVNDNCNMVR